MEMELVTEKHIIRDAKVRHGKPHISGTRIAVSDIVTWHFRLGLSVEEIAAKYDLSLASVYAALSYYFDYRTEIDAEIASGQSYYEAIAASSPSLLREKLQALQKFAAHL